VSPDGEVLVVADDDSVLRWFDTTTWKKTNENSEFLLESFALTFAPDSKQVLVGVPMHPSRCSMRRPRSRYMCFPAQAGSYVVAIEMLSNNQAAAAYLPR